MAIMTVMLFALLLLVPALLAVILIAVWVYRDAKNRGLEAWVWTLVVLLVPSFIGLLLYFLVGRKEGRRPCPACQKPVPVRSTFCGYCGAQMPEETAETPKKRGGKGLLIAGLVCLALTIVLGIGAIFTLAVRDEFFEDVDFMSVSTVYLENNWGDSWKVSFHYTTKTPDCSFRVGDDGPRTLYFEGECETGPLLLRVWQGDEERTFDLSGGEEVKDRLDLSVFGPGKVHMELYNNDGKGKNVEFEARWE